MAIITVSVYSSCLSLFPSLSPRAHIETQYGPTSRGCFPPSCLVPFFHAGLNLQTAQVSSLLKGAPAVRWAPGWCCWKANLPAALVVPPSLQCSQWSVSLLIPVFAPCSLPRGTTPADPLPLQPVLLLPHPRAKVPSSQHVPLTRSNICKTL